MKSGLLVVALTTVSLFLTSTASAQTVSPVNALVVVDANGKKVGGVLWAFPNGHPAFDDVSLVYQVVLQVSGHIFRLDLQGSSRLDGVGVGYNPGRPFNVLFESTDCSGTPYLDAGSEAFRYPPDPLQAANYLAAIGPPGRTAHIPDPTATPRQIGPQSFGDLGTGQCQTGNPEATTQVMAVRALPLVDLATEFTPPFHLVPAASTGATACCGDCNADGKVTIDELVTAVNFGLNDCPK